MVPGQKHPVLHRINHKRHLLLLVQNAAIRNDKIDVLAKHYKNQGTFASKFGTIHHHAEQHHRGN